MNGFITDARYARVWNLPISFPQTDLGSGRAIVISRIQVFIHQRIEIRALSVSVVAVLTPGVIPVYLNSAMQLASVGLYQTTMLTSPIVYAAFSEETAMTNPFSPCVVESPGIYSVIVSNNTSNVNMAVAATGSVKFYY